MPSKIIFETEEEAMNGDADTAAETKPQKVRRKVGVSVEKRLNELVSTLPGLTASMFDNMRRNVVVSQPAECQETSVNCLRIHGTRGVCVFRPFNSQHDVTVISFYLR